MLRTIFLLLAALIAALLIWVGIQPSAYRVERSALINTAPAAVYGHVYDLSKWQAWSPWAKLDPDMKVTIEGPPSGPGAIMRWAGNEKVGSGAMAIIEANPAALIKTRIDFTEPMQGTSYSDFVFEPQGQTTKVTWTLDGKQGYVERLILTLLRVDLPEMIGAEYERGLANLKALAEASPASPAAEPAAQPSAVPPG